MTSKFLAIILSTLFAMQGCIPAAFVVGAATGTVVYDNRPTRTIADDRELVFQIQSKLNNDPELVNNRVHLSVTSFNRIVLLVGQVSRDDLRARAEDIVKSYAKARLVYNEITVGKSIGNLARTNDTWITAKVKTVLATTPNLNSTSLKIVTENKIVYLMGLTTKGQGNVAAKKTRTVAGVEKVVKLFEYLS